MKLAAVPRLIEIALLHKRAVRPNDGSPTDTQELGDAVQRRIALACFAVEVINDGGGHAHFRTGQVVREIDRLVRYECVRRSGSHGVLPMSIRKEPRIRLKSKGLFMFAWPVANWRKPQWTDSLPTQTRLIVVEVRIATNQSFFRHEASPLSWSIADGIGFDPRSEIAASISDCAPNTDEARTS